MRKQGFFVGLLVLGVSACTAETEVGGEAVEQDQAPIINGTNVTPWPSGTPAYTRAIVDIGDFGCTGTVIDPEWVLTAKHCAFAVGALVRSRRPGVSPVERTVDRVEGNPTTWEDGAVLHVSVPFSDIPQVPLYWGTTSGIVNQTINCYGYGANKLGNVCGTHYSACPGGYSCFSLDQTDAAGNKYQEGVCVANTSPGQLRTAALKTSTLADQSQCVGCVQTAKSSSGQEIYPGDSGGPCFFKDQLAATNGAWVFDFSCHCFPNGLHTSLADFRSWMLATMRGQTARIFQGVDSKNVYFRNTSNELWKDNGSSANRTQIDATIRDFQGINSSLVYVLGFDNNLWREHPDLNSRDLVDSNVRKFQALDSSTVYVLDNNGDLWREIGNSSSRTWVDGNVLNFHAVNSSTVYVLGRDRNLWNETGTMSNRVLVGSSVVDFQGINSIQVYVLADDLKLWRVLGAMSNTIIKPAQVDANVQRFQAIDGTIVYVLGQDSKLWREHGNSGTRDSVDSNVATFQALDSTTVYVMGKDGKLWNEKGSMNSRTLVDQR